MIQPIQLGGSPSLPSEPLKDTRSQGVGDKLFDSATEFYDWLMGTWLSSHADQQATYQHINQLLRIADCSRKQGQFLSPADEDKALENLKMCRERLDNGEIRTQEIPGSISSVLAGLTHGNPKALLVAKLTEVEYHYCIYPAQKGAPDADPDLQRLFDHVVEEINPQLVDIKALELARELTACLETDKPSADLKPILHNWLGSRLH